MEETKQERIVHHFIEDHKRLLGGAMLTVNVTHPNEIEVDFIGLQSSGTMTGASQFTAKLKIGNTSVFYFGMINEQLEISNEAVTGRSSDNVVSNNFNPGVDLGDVF